MKARSAVGDLDLHADAARDCLVVDLRGPEAPAEDETAVDARRFAKLWFAERINPHDTAICADVDLYGNLSRGGAGCWRPVARTDLCEQLRRAAQG